MSCSNVSLIQYRFLLFSILFRTVKIRYKCFECHSKSNRKINSKRRRKSPFLFLLLLSLARLGPKQTTLYETFPVLCSFFFPFSNFLFACYVLYVFHPTTPRMLFSSLSPRNPERSSDVVWKHIISRHIYEWTPSPADIVWYPYTIYDASCFLVKIIKHFSTCLLPIIPLMRP